MKAALKVAMLVGKRVYRRGGSMVDSRDYLMVAMMVAVKEKAKAAHWELLKEKMRVAQTGFVKVVA